MEKRPGLAHFLKNFLFIILMPKYLNVLNHPYEIDLI